MIKTLLERGVIQDDIDDRDYLISSLPTPASVPSKIDHTPNMSSVKYQGNLGACVAFSAIALKEWQENIQYQNETGRIKEISYNLSEQWVYRNCKAIDPWGDTIEGTNIRSAMKVLSTIGVPCESNWEYSDDKENIGEPDEGCEDIALYFRIGSYWRINNLDELKQALIDGPVVIAIDIYEEMFSHLNHGHVPMPQSEDQIPLGCHSVCIVGYDDETQEVKFKNSWSQFFGERGYGYFTYDYINKYMKDAWTCRDYEQG